MKRNQMYREYWGSKDERAAIAVQHTTDMMSKYPNLIAFSVKHSKIYTPNYPFDYSAMSMRSHGVENIAVYDEDTVRALMIETSFSNNNIGNVAILNFASFKNPGGKFIQGSIAQEESLCHASFLYNVLKEFDSTFYSYNRSHVNKSMYMNRAIYSPNVRFENGVRYVSCGVITCAAPNINAGSKYYGVTDSENCTALYSRCKFVLDIAEDQHVDTLILGAFGCGVFGQNPYTVASMFKKLLTEYKYRFNRVIFAIPFSGHGKENNIAFKSTFG